MSESSFRKFKEFERICLPFGYNLMKPITIFEQCIIIYFP